MRRKNTTANALNTGLAVLDLGDGIEIPLPVDGDFGGVAGPPGAGVPAGGATGQLIRKTSNGSTEWATPSKSLVDLPNVDNTSDMNKPISVSVQQALEAKADAVAVAQELAEKASNSDLASKASLVGGKVPVAEIPTEAMPTDANVAAQVNATVTGAAIDARITAQVTPLVEPIVADYIAGSSVVVDAAAAAVDANPKIATLESKNVTQDAEITAARWASTASLGSTVSFDAPIPFGQTSTASAANPGLPLAVIGSAVSEKVSAASMVTYKTWGPDPRLFMRCFAVNGTPYGWKEFAGVPALNALGIRVTTLEARPMPRPFSGMKIVPLALTAPGTTVSQVMAAGSARWVRRWAVAPKRIRVHVANRNPANQTNGSQLSLTHIRVGKGTDVGGLTNQVIALAGGTLLSTGAEVVTPWTTVDVTDGDYLGVSIGWYGAAEATVQMMQGGGWTHSSNSANSSTDVAGWTREQTTPFHVWIEAEVPAATPVLLANGDSISLGTASTDPIGDAWPAVYAYNHGALPVLMGQHGSTSANWVTTSHRWSLYGGIEVGVVDAVIVHLGQNDLATAGMTVATLKTRYADVRTAHARYVAPVYVGGITPSTKATDVEAVRQEFNTWLKTLPSGERGYFDFPAAVGDVDDENLNPTYSADGLHPNTAGQAVMAALVEAAPVTPFTLAPSKLKALAGV